MSKEKLRSFGNKKSKRTKIPKKPKAQKKKEFTKEDYERLDHDNIELRKRLDDEKELLMVILNSFSLMKEISVLKKQVSDLEEKVRFFSSLNSDLPSNSLFDQTTLVDDSVNIEELFGDSVFQIPPSTETNGQEFSLVVSVAEQPCFRRS